MEFSNEFVKCKVQILENNYIKITGSIDDRHKYKNVLLVAPNTFDKSASYSGTGLPFPCADIAFQNTKNVHLIKLGNFDTIFEYPNSYYSVANKKKIISSIFFVLESHDNHREFVRFELKDLYPLRTLVNRESRTSPEFYSKKYDLLPIDTSENIMREYARIKIEYDIA
jgi:hypothetical protein